MTRPAKAFAEQNFRSGMGANLRSISGQSANNDDASPYCRVGSGELPPMMLQIRLADGQSISFAYSDIREIRCRDAGHVQLGIFAMTRVTVTIEGRHLRELSNLLGMAMVRWMEEADERDNERPETEPEIVSIRVEAVDAE